MRLTDFNDVRVGNFPICMDVRSLSGHCSDGIYAQVSMFPKRVASNNIDRLELRRKGETFALFIFKYGDTVIPKEWENSELIWRVEND